MTASVYQLAFPGMAPPPKPRPLWKLYLDAQCAYYGPIAERLEAEGRIGPEGITEMDLAGEAEFMDLDEFLAWLEREGVPFK